MKQSEMGHDQTIATRNIIYKAYGREIKVSDLGGTKIWQVAGSATWLWVKKSGDRGR